MRLCTGWVLLGIGGLHTAIGVALGRRQLLAIARDGFGDAVEPHRDRETVFWFLMTGVLLMQWGTNLGWIERHTGRVPPGVAGQLLGIGVAGGVLLPRSGFWLLLPAALLAWRGRAAAGREPALR